MSCEVIAVKVSDKVLSGPGCIVEGWVKAQPREAYTDRRVLRLRKGGQRLTTKGGKL